MGITYKDAGVDYDALDPFKRACQLAARETADNIDFGMREYAPSRGESAYLVEANDMFIAHVEEGLGTKNLIAEALERTGRDSMYDLIAKDAVAMIVNDLITVGALPVSIAMHVAVGSDAWFAHDRRVERLIRGWKQACDLAGCAWGGGETPTLRDIVGVETAVLSGSAWGLVKPKSRLMIGANVRAGDVIVLLESSGIHANGLSLARKVADRLPDGYDTPVGNGLDFGTELLKPTHLYARLLRECFLRDIVPHYAVNVTGHGWCKLMRAPQPFAYVLDEIPEPPPIFRFLMAHASMEEREAYKTFNMGAGFALILPPADARQVVDLACELELPYRAIVAGSVEKSATRRVVISPRDIEFTEEDLRIR